MAAVLAGGGTQLGVRSERSLMLAVIASIAFHAMLFAIFPDLREALTRPRLVPGPLIARLIEPRAAPAAAPVEPTPAREEPPKPERKIEHPAQRPAARRSPQPAPVAPAVPLAPPAAPAAQSAPSVAAPQSEAATGAPVAKLDSRPAAPAPSAPSAEDATTLDKFRLEIIAAARRFRNYPRVARDNNWEGRTEVRIVFNAEGRRVSVTVLKSSGHEVLDRQAVDTITKAFVPVPPALRGRDFAMEIPVIYSLKDASS